MTPEGLLGPKREGRSFHFAPLSSTQKTPAITCLLSVGGRPPFGLRSASGICPESQSNSSSLSVSIQIT